MVGLRGCVGAVGEACVGAGIRACGGLGSVGRKAPGLMDRNLALMSEREQLSACWSCWICTAWRYAGHCLEVGRWSAPQYIQEAGRVHPSALWKPLQFPQRVFPLQEMFPWPNRRQRVHLGTGRVWGRTW